MFKLPIDFQWLAPWGPIADESPALEWGEVQAELESDEIVGHTLAAELKRETPDGHLLRYCRVQVIGRCMADPNEFLFATDSKNARLARVHLTWRAETEPTWPYTITYPTMEQWKAQMQKEHLAYIKQSAGNGGS